MADITWTDVTNHASTLSAVPSAAQTDILDWVNDALDTRWFVLGEADPKLKLARIYMAAHFGIQSLPSEDGSSAGPVASRGQGDMSISYATVSVTSDSEYGTTGYGRKYLVIINGTLARGGLLL